MPGSARSPKHSTAIEFRKSSTPTSPSRPATKSKLQVVAGSPIDPGPDEFDAILVGDAQTMAGLLTRASRGGARGFAVAMHERACAEYDELQLELWASVLEILSKTTVPSSRHGSDP